MDKQLEDPLYQLINYTINSNSYGELHPTLVKYYLFTHPGKIVYECDEYDGVDEEPELTFIRRDKKYQIIRLWTWHDDVGEFLVCKPEGRESLTIGIDWQLAIEFEKVELYYSYFFKNPLKTF